MVGLKKSIKNILIFTILALIAIFIYRYYQNVKKPEVTRKYYQSKSLSAPSQGPLNFDGKSNSVKSIVKENKVARQIKDKNERLYSLIQELDQLNKACEDEIAALLPPSEVLDPEGKFFEKFDTVNERMGQVVGVIFQARKSLPRFQSRALELFENEEILESQLFYSTIQSLMLCLSSDVSLFLESALESLVKNGSDQELVELEQKMVGLVDYLVQDARLPDALLFSLNIYRIIGEARKHDEVYFNELNLLYDKISQFDENFFSEFRDEDKVQDPNDRYELYTSEMKLLYDEFNYVRKSRLREYFGDY